MANKVLVIGGGPAGLMAAGAAAENGCEVTILEKNDRVGRKLLITGKGRCNITNNCHMNTFIENIPVNGRFLYSAVSHFTPGDAIAFFEGLGIPTKTERGNRVFPVSDKAVDVVDGLHGYVTGLGCKIKKGTADSLLIQDGRATGCITSGGETYRADKVIIACGGKSYPLTGSTGDGYRLARQAGHTITEIKPSLVPLESGDRSCKEMQGLALKNISLKIVNTETGKEIYKDFGELLFTHFGISGPTVLSASSHMKQITENKYTAVIDLKPALSAEQLDKRIQRDFGENINKAVANSLGGLLPRKMIPVIIKKWGIDPAKQCNSVTKEERGKLTALLKGFSVPVSGFRPIEEAIVTSGGVSVGQISPKTMESKLLDNLYFAGEVMDVDGYTGGFNLQICYSTGVLAGQSASA